MVSLDFEHSPFPKRQMSDIKNKGNKLHIYIVYFQKRITIKLMKLRSRASDLRPRECECWEVPHVLDVEAASSAAS